MGPKNGSMVKMLSPTAMVEPVAGTIATKVNGKGVIGVAPRLITSLGFLTALVEEQVMQPFSVQLNMQ